MTDPVAVTFVSSHARLGGEENYLQKLIEELGPGWTRNVICLEEAPFVERLRLDGVPTEVIPTGRRLGIAPSAVKLRRAIRKASPDVVHANGVKAAVVCAAALAGTRTPWIWLKHDFSWDGRLANLVAARASQIVAVSEAVTETFHGEIRKKVHVVHNGLPKLHVDRARGRERLHSLLGGDAAEVVSLVARLDPTKGHRELIAILPELLEDRPGLHVAFIGAEHFPHLEFAADLRNEIVQSGLEHSASFVGFHENALELIAGSDVIAIPSTIGKGGLGREGFPFVGLEAMAVGTPVVAYAHGGLPEMLGDCSRLVPPNDRRALRDAILGLLADPDAHAKAAACGRTRVQERFSLTGMVDAMRERYRDAA